jgi:hypothetical protein
MSLDYSLNQMLQEKCGRDDVGEYDSIRQATDDNKMRSRKYARIQIPSQQLIFIAFPRQQLLRESASALRYTYVACPVSFLTYIMA